MFTRNLLVKMLDSSSQPYDSVERMGISISIMNY